MCCYIAATLGECLLPKHFITAKSAKSRKGFSLAELRDAFALFAAFAVATAFRNRN